MLEVVYLKSMHMKKLTCYLTFFLSLLISQKILAQAASSRVYSIIPKEYQHSFKEDEKKFLEYTNPAAGAAGRAYNLWQYAAKGQIKSYNPDSLHAVYKLLKEEDFLRKIAFIKQHPGSYASLYYFN